MKLILRVVLNFPLVAAIILVTLRLFFNTYNQYYNKVKYVINSIETCSNLISDIGTHYFFLFNIVE